MRKGRRPRADLAAAAPPGVTWTLDVVVLHCVAEGELPRACPQTRVVRGMLSLRCRRGVGEVLRVQQVRSTGADAVVVVVVVACAGARVYARVPR